MELSYITKLVAVLRRRLSILELRNAMLGIYGDPVIVIQIEDINKAIQDIHVILVSNNTNQSGADQIITDISETLQRRYGSSRYLKKEYYGNTNSFELDSHSDEYIASFFGKLRQRLILLELQEAEFGIDTPIDIVMEIEDIKQEIQEIASRRQDAVSSVIPVVNQVVDVKGADYFVIYEPQNAQKNTASIDIDPAEVQHHINLYNTYRGRLRSLELQNAGYGTNTRPSIIIESERIREYLQDIKVSLINYGIGDDILGRNDEQVMHERSVYSVHTRRLQKLREIADLEKHHAQPYIFNEIEWIEAEVEIISGNFVKPEDEDYLLIIEVLAARKNRMFSLEVQAAMYGSSTQPEIIFEISELKKDVARLEMRLLPGCIPENTEERIAQLREIIQVYNRRSDELKRRLSRIRDRSLIEFEIEVEDIKIKIDALNKQIKQLEPLSISVFVSYSRVDWQEYSQLIVNNLLKSGFKVWVDQHLLEGGQDWLDEINLALRTHDYMVLCVTPNSIVSKYVKMEYRYFISRNKPIFPVICSDTELPVELLGIEYFSFHQIDRLIDAIKNKTVE